MKTIIVAAAAALLALSAHAAPVNVAPDPQVQIFEHGGGCRKDSLPGMCCHMDHSTGIVHCH